MPYNPQHLRKSPSLDQKSLFPSYNIYIKLNLLLTTTQKTHLAINLVYPITPPPMENHYIVCTHLFLTLGRDIELNLGPIQNLLRNHPRDHKK
jgi:hypothetical protein